MPIETTDLRRQVGGGAEIHVDASDANRCGCSELVFERGPHHQNSHTYFKSKKTSLSTVVVVVVVVVAVVVVVVVVGARSQFIPLIMHGILL